MERVVLHVDLDAFFASCEEVKDPSLKNKPVIIGADPKKGRGVVSTANYEARKYGIGSAMPISKAYKKCPDGIFLRGDFSFYKEVSQRIFSYVASLGYPYEQGGIDEAYLELTGISYKKAEEMGNKLRKFVFETEKITCSVGIGPNKLVAKICSDYKKPNGLTIIRKEEVEKFLSPLPVKKIPGIGPKTTVRLKQMGVEKVSDLVKMSLVELKNKFGNKWGEWLFNKSRGKSNSSIGVFRERKSISAERTFLLDVSDKEAIYERIHDLAKKISSEMKEKGFVSKTLVLKIRYEDFETHTVQKTLFNFVTEEQVMKVAESLLEPFLQTSRKIRLVGIRFTNLEKRKIKLKQLTIYDFIQEEIMVAKIFI